METLIYPLAKGDQLSTPADPELREWEAQNTPSGSLGVIVNGATPAANYFSIWGYNTMQSSLI
jgi:hypothetical protein